MTLNLGISLISKSDTFCGTGRVLVIDMGIKDSTNMPFAAKRKPITEPEGKTISHSFFPS
jgi:hypothetical protein